jgi:hypothetical protein
LNGGKRVGCGSFCTIEDYGTLYLKPVLYVFGGDGVNESGDFIIILANEQVVISGEDFMAFGV